MNLYGGYNIGFYDSPPLLALQLFAHLSVSFGATKYLTVRANTEFFNTDINAHRQSFYLDYGRLYLISYRYQPSVSGATNYAIVCGCNG